MMPQTGSTSINFQSYVKESCPQIQQLFLLLISTLPEYYYSWKVQAQPCMEKAAILSRPLCFFSFLIFTNANSLFKTSTVYASRTERPRCILPFYDKDSFHRVVCNAQLCQCPEATNRTPVVISGTTQLHTPDTRKANHPLSQVNGNIMQLSDRLHSVTIRNTLILLYDNGKLQIVSVLIS
jgi:hypothetical protein